MDSFTIELVSNASFKCYPNSSLSSFIVFLLEQIHLKREWEVAISEISYHSFYQNDSDGKFAFIDGRESSEEKYTVQNMIQAGCGTSPSFRFLHVMISNHYDHHLS